MAERGRYLSGFVELNKLCVEVGSGFEGEHGPLASGDYDSIKGMQIDLGNGLSVLDQRGEARCGNETHADEVGG
jgi:hypothetical protein